MYAGFRSTLYSTDELKSLISKEPPSPGCLGPNWKLKKTADSSLSPPWSEFDILAIDELTCENGKNTRWGILLSKNINIQQSEWTKQQINKGEESKVESDGGYGKMQYLSVLITIHYVVSIKGKNSTAVDTHSEKKKLDRILQLWLYSVSSGQWTHKHIIDLSFYWERWPVTIIQNDITNRKKVFW